MQWFTEETYGEKKHVYYLAADDGKGQRKLVEHCLKSYDQMKTPDNNLLW